MIGSFCLKPKKWLTREERRKKAKFEDLNLAFQGKALEFKAKHHSSHILQCSTLEFKVERHSCRIFWR